MAKGGGRGKGRPKKVAILAQPEFSGGIPEIGECSKTSERDGTVAEAESCVEHKEELVYEEKGDKDQEDKISVKSVEM